MAPEGLKPEMQRQHLILQHQMEVLQWNLMGVELTFTRVHLGASPLGHKLAKKKKKSKPKEHFVSEESQYILCVLM